MATAKLQHWMYVAINTKSLADASTKTYYLSNRPIIDDVNVGRYIPILNGVSAFGVKLGDYINDPQGATVVIENSPSSFGYERKFSDILERETIVGQSISLYYAETELTDLNISADFQLAWTATMLSSTFNSNTLSLRIASVGIPSIDIGKVITVKDFPSAPNENIGKVLPLILGNNVEVQPLQISVSADTTPNYAYGITFATQYSNAGCQKYYIKNKNGSYVEFQSGSTVGPSYTIQYGSFTSSGVVSINEQACRLRSTGAYNYLVTHVSIAAVGASYGGTVDGQLILRIYDHNTATNGPGNLLAQSIRNKTDFTANFAASSAVPYTADFALPEVVVLKAGQLYYISLQETQGVASALFYRRWFTGAGTNVAWIKDPTGTSVNANTFVPTTSAGFEIFESYLWGAKVTDNNTGSGTINSNSGYGHSYITLSQRSAPSGQSNPLLTELDLVCSVNGIQDNGSGTITGVASTLIEYPLHVFKILDHIWLGALNWTPSIFDFTKFTASHGPITSSAYQYYRKVKGRTSGLITLQSLIIDICRNMACRVSLVKGSASKLGLYAWGSAVSNVQTYSDEDCKIESIEISGGETVINDVSILYGNSIIYQNLTGVFSGAVDRHLGAYDFNPLTSSYASAIIGQSTTLFGARRLSDTSFDWIGDSTSASSISEYYIRNFNTPKVRIVLAIPFFKSQTSDSLDVVTIVHPDLPAYFGTSSNSQYASFSGSSVDAGQGEYSKRGNSYRVQIEGRELVFDSNSISYNRFTGIILNNSRVDPT